MFAADKGHLEIVKLLLKHNANPYIEDEDGYNALSHAEKKGYTEVAHEIRKKMEEYEATHSLPPSPHEENLFYEANTCPTKN